MDRGTSPPLGRWLPLLGVGALLGLAALAAALSSAQVTRVPVPRQSEPVGGPFAPPTVAPSFYPPPSDEESWVNFAVPGWLTTLATALCGLAVATIVIMLVWYIIRDFVPLSRPVPVVEPGEPGRLTASPEEMMAAVDAGLVGLSDADRDPRRAIIACWLRLEEAAAAAGTPRELGDTSTDLVIRLLLSHRVSRGVLDEFAAVYRWARYGTGPVDEAMRSTAVSALRHLRAELAASVAAAEAAAAEAAAAAAAAAAAEAEAARLAEERAAR
jgi:Domain of unknown function (DUF4129)